MTIPLPSSSPFALHGSRIAHRGHPCWRAGMMPKPEERAEAGRVAGAERRACLRQSAPYFRGLLDGGRLFSKEALQAIGLVGGDQVIDELVQLAVEHALQIIASQADAVVGHAILGEVIGTNLLAAIAHLYL